MELTEIYNQLKDFFGESNIKVEYIFDSDLDTLYPRQFSKIQLTHLPTGKVIIGDKFNTQIENTIDALQNLKLEINKKRKHNIPNEK